MKILNKLFTKNRTKTNIECAFKHSFVCSVLKRQFFSQEIHEEERISTGSHEENSALLPSLIFINSRPRHDVRLEAS